MRAEKSGASPAALALSVMLLRARSSAKGRLVFNRTVTLRDTWAKIEQSGQG